MRSEEAKAVGEALLRRMQRLLARAGRVNSTDRRQLVALIDDVETTRWRLLKQRAEVESEMRQATVRATAIGAYMRTSQAGRDKRYN